MTGVQQAARRELERQRQMEWEKQRREQLMSEKLREQAAVDKLRKDVGSFRQELSLLVKFHSVLVLNGFLRVQNK